MYMKKSGVGLMDLFLVGFVCMKLAGVVDWSWWWVTSPLWISLLLSGLVILLADIERKL